jgi:hypothetical protein
MTNRSLNLEHVHAKLYKQILLTESYTECKGLEFIIKSCRLKPLQYIENKKPNIILYRKWIDEFGNTLNIVKNKRINIKYNDLSIKRKSLSCTDLYYGLSIDKIAKISKLVYICAGTEEDFYQPCYMITFLGLDNYLRTYMYLYDEWEQISPLCLGLKNLKLIASKRDIKYFLHFNKIKDMPIPCIKADQWLSLLPVSNSLLNVLNKDHKIISDLIQGK